MGSLDHFGSGGVEGRGICGEGLLEVGVDLAGWMYRSFLGGGEMLTRVGVVFILGVY
jgi:hypothetical protein